MSWERTFVMIKPDAVNRGLVGTIISRLEAKGLRLEAMKMQWVDEDLARRHYAAHVDKPFFPSLLQFITSAPVVAMVWSGREAISVTRNLLGATDGSKAAPGTIRGDFASDVGMNLCHGSDSPQAAEREIELWFDDGELLNYTRDIDRWIIES
ncbi:MAG TPA: nucleoside-diphosphate kinase [Sphingobacteriaceae bacterium]|nr:nucleoside-diphosphate kinase [Sphingobacteriaceae bacterium]